MLFLSNGFEALVRRQIQESPWDNVSRFPPVKVSGHKDDLKLRFQFALAGYSRDDVEIKFTEDYLILTLNKKEEVDDKWEVFSSSLKEVKNVYYKYYVPPTKFDTDKAEASFKDGILTITIPMAEKSKPKKITIK